ncbi:MAG: hypothetical protein ACYDD6_06040 [Acidimicrobiales bacterium]
MALNVSTPQTRQLRPVETDAPRKATENSVWEVLSKDNPYVHIVEVSPGSVVPAHSHSTSEVMVVVGGSLSLDGSICDSGSIAIIPSNEKYSFEVGAEGVTFVVVRPGKAAFSSAE